MDVCVEGDKCSVLFLSELGSEEPALQPRLETEVAHRIQRPYRRTQLQKKDC